jgi:CoA:oxalate CoA-transferase
MPEIAEPASKPVVLNALPGVRVVEFGSNFAGPYAGMILAQLGADVIKVESPDGDDSRRFAGRIGDTSIAFAHVNVGKRGCVADMKTEGGIEAVHRLLATADVVVQSLRPGSADALGIGRSAVLERVPDLLYYDVTAFGNGPEGATMPGYDPMVQAFTGIMQMTGHDGTPPTRCAPSIIDFGTGQWVALAILAALLARKAGTPVRALDTALVDTAFSVVPYQATAAYMHQVRPSRAGSGNPIAAPYQCYRARDGYLLIAAANQRLWRSLVVEIGAPELLTDARFATPEQRSRHRAELETILDERLAGATVEEWTRRLRAARVPAGSVMHLDEAVASGIAVERQTFARAGEADLVRLPVRFDDRPLAWRRPAPRLGEHTVEILREIGYEPNRIDTLLAEGAVGAGG